MARFKDRDWNLPTKDNGNISGWESVHAALLMDIRDQLQQLNRLLGCSNFIGIPHTLTAIKRNTTRRKKRAATLKRVA